MKKIIKQALLTGGCIAAFTACDDNSWNDHLDGFEGNPAITDIQTIDYTLTDADYSSIAGLKANKELAGDEHSKALKAVGTQHYFNDEILARDYVPAFLSDSSFPYFTLSDGSAIKLTYNVAQALPDEIKGIGAAQQYTVSDEDYQAVWGSADDYTASFSPSHTAASSLPGILKDAYPDAEKGDYVIVNYETSDVDPVFSGSETPEFTMSDVIATVAEGSTYDINGVITAVSTNGFVVTDNSGSIFTYMGNSFDASAYPIGTQIKANAKISVNNTGLQIAGSSSTFDVVGTQSYEYPAPKIFTKEDIATVAKRSGSFLAVYGQMTGKVVISGKNINIDLGCDNGAMGGCYYVTPEIQSQLKDGEQMTVTGYFIAVAASRYCNFVVTKVESAVAAKRHNARARIVTVPSVNENAVYCFDGAKWQKPASTLVLNAADYTAMGQKYGNLEHPESYLPAYLKLKCPYAQPEDKEFVVYKYYANKETTYRCDQYIFNGTEWILNNGVVEETAQFVRTGGRWIYDPNVTINLPAGKGIASSTLYYQACVDWVYEHIDKPLGSTSITSGAGYVTKYGNNEYYSGTSAYQGNVDLRATSAKSQYAAGYANMSDDEIVALMKKRFCEEVFPGALSTLHPDAMPIDGLTVIYTVNFAAYDGSSTNNYTAKFEVIGKGQFKFVECNW